jgi:hypothetical protein
VRDKDAAQRQVLAADLASIPEAQIEDALLITLQGAARTLRMTPEEERGEVPAPRLYVVAGVDRAAFEAVVSRLALSVKADGRVRLCGGLGRGGHAP